MTIPLAGWVAPFGYPRINARSRLPVAFRSVPRPSSPPGTKASTECPSRARDHPDPPRDGPITMHGNHPQPCKPRTIPLVISHLAHLAPEPGQPRETKPPPREAAARTSGQTCDRQTQRRTKTRFTLTKTTRPKPGRQTAPPPVGGQAVPNTTPATPTPEHPLERPGDPPGEIIQARRSSRVETIGFEPTTPCLQSRCSPN
jgi:hypothetical protein